MDAKKGGGSNWSLERRVEGLLNKHTADMALQALQQRLSAVSDEMSPLSENMSRSDDHPNHGEDLHRRAGVSFIQAPLPETYNTDMVPVPEKFIPGTLLPPLLSGRRVT